MGVTFSIRYQYFDLRVVGRPKSGTNLVDSWKRTALRFFADVEDPLQEESSLLHEGGVDRNPVDTQWLRAPQYLKNAFDFHTFGGTTRWVDRQLYEKRYELRSAAISLCCRDLSERAWRDELRFAEN